MKKTAIILGAVLLLFTASINAQNDTTTKSQPAQTEPTMSQPDAKQPAMNNSTTSTNSNDRWNNWSPDKYKMLPMPEPLTTEKIFPVLGHYTVTEKAAQTNAAATDNATTTAPASDVTITLD